MSALKSVEQTDSEPEKLAEDWVAELALNPALSCGQVVREHVDFGKGTDHDQTPGDMGLFSELLAISSRVSSGDMSEMEAMLVAQAYATNSVFARLAQLAAIQPNPKRHDGLMALALKAQASSRATITALAELKNPRQAVFAKQANVTSGPQQVNNGVATSHQPANAAPQPAPALELADGHVLVPEVPAKQASEPRARTRAKSGIRAKQTIHGS